MTWMRVLEKFKDYDKNMGQVYGPLCAFWEYEDWDDNSGQV
jgi:hypothetical protein